MQKLRPRFLASPKKAVLIKLLSALGFGGMVGFCILGCDKPQKGGGASVQEDEDIRDMPEVYAPPSYLNDERRDKKGENSVTPSTDVSEPTPSDAVMPPVDVKEPQPDIVQKYAPRRPLDS